MTGISAPTNVHAPGARRPASQGTGPGPDFAEHLRDAPGRGAKGRAGEGTGTERVSASTKHAQSDGRPGASDDGSASRDDPVEASGPAAGAVPDRTIGQCARLFPEHWYANGFLSMAGTPGTMSDPSADARASESTFRAVETTDAGAVSRAVATAKGVVPDSRESFVAAVSVRGAGMPDRGVAEPEHPAIRSWATAATADGSWPERLVRLSRRDDGALTLWLRDFSMSDAAARSVVDDACARLARAGHRVGRIVVNGNEFWSANDGTSYVPGQGT